MPLLPSTPSIPFTQPASPRPPWHGVPARSFCVQPGLSVSLVTPQAGQQLCAVLEEGDGARWYFTCLLRGSAQVCHQRPGREQRFEVQAQQTLATFAPGQRVALQTSAACCNVELRIAPPLLQQLAGHDGASGATGLRPGVGTLRIVDAARRLEQLLAAEHANPLLLHAASLEFLAWHLHPWQPQETGISARERRLLQDARDFLLRDLARAPTIAQLARETGLNTLKLKRGFRSLFGSSVHALFQRARMERARELLPRHSVTETAALLGYSNISHFGQAFRKQFGVLPGQMRRR